MARRGREGSHEGGSWDGSFSRRHNVNYRHRQCPDSQDEAAAIGVVSVRSGVKAASGTTVGREAIHRIAAGSLGKAVWCRSS